MSTGIAKPTVPVSQQAQTMIQQMRDRFALALGKRVTVEKLGSMVALAVAGNRALEECSAGSIVQSAYRAAMLNLSPDPVLGEAYIVPYKGVATLQIGYKGMIKLALRGGIRKIYAQIVREGEAFTATLGIHPDLTHTPGYGEGQPTHAYAVAWLASGEVDFEVLAWAEVMAIKARSKAGNNGPWVTDPAEMAKKTAIRRLCKRLNLEYESPDAVALIASDDDDAGAVRRVFSTPMPELDALTSEPAAEPETATDAAPAATAPPPPPPRKTKAPPPPPVAAEPAPLLSGAAIIGPLTAGLTTETVLDFIKDWSPPGAPSTATSLDQVLQAHLEIVQRDPADWKAKLNAWLTP